MLIGRFRKLVLAGACLALVLGGIPVFAGEGGVEDQVVSEGEVIEGDHFMAGADVMMKGTVDGDLYVTGGRVKIDGLVTGDVLVLGGDVDVRGEVQQDVRVLGGEVMISGNIGKNLSLFAGRADVVKDAEIKGSIAAFSGQIDLWGKVGKDFRWAGGAAKFDGEVKGDVELAGNQIGFDSKTVIAGDLRYVSSQEANIARDAKIVGQKEYVQMAQGHDWEQRGWASVSSFLVLLVTGLFFWLLVPRHIERGVELANQKPLHVLIFGLVGLILIPIAGIVLLLTQVGWVLGTFVLFGWFFALYFGKMMVAFWLGKLLVGRMKLKNMMVWSLVAGGVVLAVLSLISYAGEVIGLLISIWGLGILVLMKQEIYLFLRKKKMV